MSLEIRRNWLKRLAFNKTVVRYFICIFKIELPMTTQRKTNQGFTLIELILVIVILGILSVVAIPKYKDVRESAEFNSLMKIVYDSLTSVPGAFKSAVDLEGQDPTTIELKDLITITGKNWTYIDSANEYQYKTAAQIRLNPEWSSMVIRVNCDNFKSEGMKSKCAAEFPAAATSWQEVELIRF